MPNAKVVIEIDGDNIKFKRSLDEAKAVGEKGGQELADKITAPLAKGFLSVQGAIVALAASLAGGALFKHAVDEAINAENAINALSHALALNGKFSQEAIADLEGYAKALQSTTTASDDAILQGQALLATIGQLSGDKLQRATKAALDLSAATGRDLGSSFELVSRAAEGNTAGLGRLGLKIDQTLPKYAQFDAALQLIEKRMGGSAESAANTFGGAIAQLTNNFKDVLEEFGKMFTQSPVVVAFIKQISEAFKNFAEKLGLIRDGGDIVGNLIKNLIQVGQTIVTYVIAPLEFMFNLLKASFQTIVLFGDIFIAAIVNIGGGILEFLIIPIGTAIRLMQAAAEALGLSIADSLKVAGDAVVALETNVSTALASTRAVVTDQAAQTSQAFKDSFNFDISEKSSQFLTDLQATADGANAIGQTIMNGANTSLTDFQKRLQEASVSINKALQDGIMKTISTTIATVGASLVQGGKAFANFGHTILGIIGDMAISIGTTLLSVGLGIDALRASLLTLSGGQVIAAGIALIAIGGLLKSLSGADVGGAPQGGGATGVTSAGGEATGFNSEPQNQKPSTAIAVNIQGNVLDRRQTGLEIAEVLNETFGTSDTKIAGIA